MKSSARDTILKIIYSKHILVVLIFTLICLFVSQSACLATTVALSWNPNTEPNLAGYKVYYKADSSSLPFNGTGAAEGASPIVINTSTNAIISGLDPNRAYYFAVTAYNTSGAESAYSNIFSIPETVSPITTLSSPANNTTVSGTVSITASASDNVAVTHVDFYINGILRGSDTSAPYVYSWDTTVMTSGVYVLTTMAYDAAGNIGLSNSVSVTVVNDTIAPTISLSAPANGATVSGNVVISADATDNVGVTKVEFYENGALLFVSNVSPYSYSWNTKVLANGSYTLIAKAYDAMGNIGQSTNVTVTVNNTVPDITAPIVSAFALPATSTSQTVTISSLIATDAVGVTGYLVTESSAVPSASAPGWSALAPSSFTFVAVNNRTAYAWAKDAAGNISASRSATVSYPTLQAAFDSASASGDVLLPAAGTILASSGLVPELIANTGSNVIIAGGYDALYQTRSGVSVVVGGMKIRSGKVVAVGLALRTR